MTIRASYRLERAPEPAPRIAIVTPAFNSANHLGATIASILGQDYPNLAYHVQDGASTDGSLSLLESYGDAMTWQSEVDSGQGNAINRGFHAIEGEIMAYINSDDTLLPGSLAYAARFFANHPEVDLIYGHRITIDATGAEVGRWVLPPHDAEALKWADYLPQETMFWRRRVWDAIGPLNEDYHYALDWDFVLRAQAAGFRFHRVPRFMACFRIHEAQKTTGIMDVGVREMTKLRQIHLGRRPEQSEIIRAVANYLRRHLLFHGLYSAGLLRY